MKKLIFILISSIILTACSDSSEQAVEESAPPQKTTSTAQIDPHQGHDHSHEHNDSGEAYETLAQPYPTGVDDKVVVYEFFGYLCGHCYNFEPQMTMWEKNKPDYVEVIKIPVNFNRGWDVLQLGYITASSMGIAEQTHAKVFAALHKERKNFRTINDLAQWYADNSEVTKEEFLSTAQSFIIDSNVRQANKMGLQMQITSTPTIVINGKFKPVARLSSREDVLQTMDELVETEAKAMGIIGSE